MAGTNDSSSKTANEILQELKDLELWIMKKTDAKVIFLMPTVRDDRHVESRTVRELQTKLAKSYLNVIDNTNITEDHLSQHRLHLNPSGSSLLAANIINYVRGAENL